MTELIPISMNEYSDEGRTRHLEVKDPNFELDLAIGNGGLQIPDWFSRQSVRDWTCLESYRTRFDARNPKEPFLPKL